MKIRVYGADGQWRGSLFKDTGKGERWHGKRTHNLHEIMVRDRKDWLLLQYVLPRDLDGPPNDQFDKKSKCCALTSVQALHWFAGQTFGPPPELIAQCRRFAADWRSFCNNPTARALLQEIVASAKAGSIYKNKSERHAETALLVRLGLVHPGVCVSGPCIDADSVVEAHGIDGYITWMNSHLAQVARFLANEIPDPAAPEPSRTVTEAQLRLAHAAARKMLESVRWSHRYYDTVRAPGKPPGPGCPDLEDEPANLLKLLPVAKSMIEALPKPVEESFVATARKNGVKLGPKRFTSAHETLAVVAACIESRILTLLGEGGVLGKRYATEMLDPVIPDRVTAVHRAGFARYWMARPTTYHSILYEIVQPLRLVDPNDLVATVDSELVLALERIQRAAQLSQPASNARRREESRLRRVQKALDDAGYDCLCAAWDGQDPIHRKRPTWSDLARAVHRMLGLKTKLTSTTQALKQRAPRTKAKWNEIGAEMKRERDARSKKHRPEK